MPGQPGAISFSGPKGSMYLGTVIGVWREGDGFKLTGMSRKDIHLRVKANGAVTNGQMLYRLIEDLWANESADGESRGVLIGSPKAARLAQLEGPNLTT